MSRSSEHAKSLAALAGAILALSLAGCQAFDDAEDDQQTQTEHKAITTETLEPYECGQITRLHTFQGVFLASQPAPEDFEQAKMGGVRTVINIRHPSEQGSFDEAAHVRGLGLNYENPAWNGPDELTDDIIEQQLELLRTAERPILFHCSSANRVGAIWLIYRALDGGLSNEQALAEAKVVGLTSPDYQRIALDYVNRHRN